jgi:hypothetical protein
MDLQRVDAGSLSACARSSDLFTPVHFIFSKVRVEPAFGTYKPPYIGIMNVYLPQANFNTTFNNGSLGSRIDEERSEMR